VVAARRVDASAKTVAGAAAESEVVMGADAGTGAEAAGGVDICAAQAESKLPRDFGPVLTRTMWLRHFEFGARTP
jgi:hypothetical protein